MYKQEKELFKGYEIKNWNFTPRLYKIFAAATALNLLTILVLGQTNLLTTRGCDSFVVSRVCQVLDAVYVGSSLLGTDSEFVSKEYDKTDLENSEITYIDVSSETPPFTYPAGYFPPLNPDDELASVQNFGGDVSTVPPAMGGFSSIPPISSGADLMAIPQVTPKPNKNAVTGKMPESPFSFGGANPIPVPPRRSFGKPGRLNNPKSSKSKLSSSDELPNLEGDQVAANKEKAVEDKEKEKIQPPVNSDPVSEVDINKKPFEDLGDTLIDKIAKKEVDLSKPFSVVLEGTLNPDGKFDDKKSRFGKSEGDQQMIDVAKDTLQAVGDSGILRYLKNSGIDKVTIKLIQDDKQIYAIIVSDQKTPEKAGTTASGFNTLLSGVKLLDQNGFKKLDENSKTLINNSKITAEGKNFVLNFSIPKPLGQDLINRSLKERADKKNSQPSNSGEASQNASAKTGK